MKPKLESAVDLELADLLQADIPVEFAGLPSAELLVPLGGLIVLF